MKHISGLIYAAGFMAAVVSTQPAAAFEFGTAGASEKPGITLGGASAGTPPPGIYMFDQFATYQAKIVGPGAPPGSAPVAQYDAAATGFLFVPGWNVFGGSYS